MTSTPQPAVPRTQPSNKAVSAIESTGSSAPLASVPTRPSYAHATKKSVSHAQLETTDAPMAVGSSTPNQSGGAESISPINGKSAVTPAVPTVGGAPAIVNGANVPNPTSPSDHARKPSFTVSASAASGYPNGGPAGGPPSRTNSIQFGSVNAGSSPAPGNPANLANQSSSNLGVASQTNPRISSPQTSPSPIPQPAASGGRPPSSLQPQGNGVSFGSLGGESNDPNRQMRPLPQGPLASGPQAAHLRRESSQSAHGDMGNPGMNAGPGRGGYPQQASRGRGGFGSYPQQMGYSPQQSFRPPPGQGRGGMNMAGPPYHPQGRPLQGYPSPNPAARSPALANSHPATPNMGQIPMNNQQMPGQHFAGYAPHMGPPQGYPMQPGFDPSMGYYGQQFIPAHQLQPMQQYMPPSSPRPSYMPQGGPPAPYMQPQYSNPQQSQPQAAPLSRTSSQISATDRPGSSLGGQQTPSVGNVSTHGHTASRATNSPAPKSQFTVPKKSAGIVIKDPNSGAIKTFDKPQPASPARATPSPSKMAGTPSNPTPPPRSVSQAGDSSHARTESISTKTDEEKKREMQEAVARKVAADEAAAKLKKEEAEAQQMREEAEQKLFKEQEETKAREAEAKAREEALKAEEESEANEAAKAKEEAKAKADEKAEAEKREQEIAKAKEDEASEPSKDFAPAETEESNTEGDDFEAQIAEMERLAAEEEARELAAEAEYQRKKQAQREEQARKEAEEAAAYEANMKQAEREAEAAEEERIKRLEAMETDESRKIFASLKNKDAPTPPSDASPAVRTPTESGAQTPVSDISMGPPAKTASGGKQKPAALKLETTKQVEPPQPSAAMKSLHSARFLEDPRNTLYPPSIVSPNVAVNPAAPSERKFKYNKEFLLQFQTIFKEKPSLDWDAKVRDTLGDGGDSSARPQSARTPSMMGGRNPSNRPGIPQNFSMGSFGAPPRPQPLPAGTTSAERFAMSNAAMTAGQRGPAMTNPFQQFGRPTGMPIGGAQMSRSNSSNPMQSAVPSSPRVGGSSHRGSARSGSKRDKTHAKKDAEQDKTMPLTAGLDLKPITHSATGWVPMSIRNSQKGPAPGGEGLMAPDVVQRKVKALLNKMTPDNFDRIAGQIIEIANQSKHESDGRTLRQVIQLLFEKATDEPPWASMYASLAHRMLENMSPEIKDEGIRDKAGNVVTGGGLFRKYLLNRCQEEFERGWKTQLPPLPEGESKEAAILSDEYYVAAAAKRRGLGLVKFIGELYKLAMLTERIMHECVKKLLDYEGVPDEAEIESLTSLLRTIGSNLDASEKGALSMNAYFDRIKKTIEIPDLPSRLKFMLMDIVDLRKANWRSKDDNKGPKTIQEIREDAARQQIEAEQERLRTQRAGGGRMPMGRGDARNFSGGYGQMPPPDYTSNKVGSDDLRRLGKSTGRNVSNTGSTSTFGPSSLFAGRTNSGRKGLGPGGAFTRGGEDSGASSRTATPPAQKEREKKEKEEAAKSTNAFSALEALEGEHSLATSPPSSTSSPPATKSRPAIERQRSKSPSKEKEGEGSAETS